MDSPYATASGQPPPAKARQARQSQIKGAQEDWALVPREATGNRGPDACGCDSPCPQSREPKGSVVSQFEFPKAPQTRKPHGWPGFVMAFCHDGLAEDARSVCGSAHKGHAKCDQEELHGTPHCWRQNISHERRVFATNGRIT